jgi:Na+-driven multidrug efflux pump
MMLISFFLATPLSKIFVSYDEKLLDITVRGMQIYSFSFIFSGFGIFGSSFFTALNNGPISALISSMRTLVYQVLSILLLPMAFGLDGIWFSIVLAEALSFATTWIFLFAKRKKYGYM